VFIYIDESGSFVPSPTANSWNVVAAYVVPEATRKRTEQLLRELKIALGRSHTDEVKLKDLTEAQLKAFLFKLSRLDATLFVSCIDLGSQQLAVITAHKNDQVDKIRVNKPRMRHKEGRALIEDLATRVEHLSPQLYTQFVVQIDLLDQVYRSTTMYYAQRIPATLGSFRWRIDEKNSARPLFEETMKYMAPPLLQARSLNEPAIFVEGLNYTHFERAFRYEHNEIPTYLQEETGIEIRSASNLGKVLRDFTFVRSHDVPGVQVADLLASAFRRMLRNEFQDSLGMAGLLGALTVQRAKPHPSIHLISLSKEKNAYGHVFDVAHAAKVSARRMLK
jgi:hypothetical protein